MVNSPLGNFASFFNPDTVNAAWILAVLIFAFLANVIIGLVIELWHFRKDKDLEARIRKRGARCQSRSTLRPHAAKTPE